jgi:N-glycosidase YbiA
MGAAQDPVTFRGGPLSNFAVSPFEAPDPHTGQRRRYRTVEHFFQAHKAIDAAGHAAVADAPTPREAKRQGRRVALREDWEEVKQQVMLDGLRRKFALPRFREVLLATGDRPIMEDSRYDFEWGARDADGGWGGQNLLGRLLEQVRAELRAAETGPAQLELM